MSEERMLPCPACGSEELGNPTQNSAQKELGFYYVWCCLCGTCGPQRDEPKPAIHDWNSLPRVLRWTKEPPKELGRYWWRKAPRERLYIVELFPAEQHINMPLICVRYAGIDDKVHYMTKLDGEWAGPIPEPKEAADAR